MTIIADGVDNEYEDDDNEDQSADTDDGESDQEGDEDGSDPSDDDNSDGKRNNHRNGYEKRISKLTRRLREAEAERDRLKSGDKREAPKSDDKPSGKPLLKEFDTYEDWVEALTDFKADQKISGAMKVSKEESEKDRAEREFLKSFNAGKKSFKDWNKVVTDDVEVTPAMQRAIKDSDMPADIVYYLGKNPNEAERILELPAGKQALAIGKIEAKLESQKNANKRDADEDDEPRRVSKAPEPTNPTKSSGKNLEKSYDKMSFTEFVAARRRDALKAQGR